MSLASVLQTALSGMTAASSSMDVVSNNLANSRTVGFKAIRAQFATQTPRTVHAGTAPSAASGGSNPVQIGTGVRTTGAAVDFSQGSIVASADPLQMALEGDGLFIVAAPTGERLYTRAGEFQLNGEGQIVTSGGYQLLGYGVDEQHQVEAGELRPLSIQLGSTAVGADGSAVTLMSFSVRENGRIVGRYSDGLERDLGQVRIARFANPSGLEAVGGNLFREGVNSGVAVEANPGDGGFATVVGGAVELSNTDVGQNLVDMVLASEQFAANATVFHAADSLLDELIHLRRSDD